MTVTTDASAATPRVLERIARSTPLALRLRDVVTGHLVRDATVAVIRDGQAAPLMATTTPSGTYVTHGVKSLVSWELRDALPDGSAPPPPVLPVPRSIVVRDPQGRFRSFVIDIDLPVEGLLDTPCGSPGQPQAIDGATLPLYSLPARPVPPGLAVVRASLVFYGDRRPAAYAALEVSNAGGAPFRGVADQRGEVVVILPYPPMPRSMLSTPASVRQPLQDSTWQLDVRAFLPATAVGDAALPDLCALLNQTPARLRRVGAETEVTTATLAYGHELHLQSSQTESELLVGE